MTPVDQSFLHDPENGQWGDCMRACVASLLNVPASAVPHFYEDGNDREFERKLKEYLESQGLMELQCAPKHHVLNVPCYHLIYGYTERGTYHAVVGLNGKMVHDPHPSRAGLLDDGRRTNAFLVRTFWRPE